jgi:protein ImuB
VRHGDRAITAIIHRCGSRQVLAIRDGAIARATRHGVTVLRSDADERTAAANVPLARLDIDPKLRDALARLGVTSVGQMVRLPGGGILERFGREAHRLYQLAAGERWDPLVPVAPPEAPDERVLLDDEGRRRAARP